MTIATILRQGVPRFKLTLNQAQLEAFECYSRELIAWNQRTNLTSLTDPAEIAIKHFLDSLSIFPALPTQPAQLSLIDVGSGAGFPGLPLKLARPSLQLTLLEATGKKNGFSATSGRNSQIDRGDRTQGPGRGSRSAASPPRTV